MGQQFSESELMNCLDAILVTESLYDFLQFKDNKKLYAKFFDFLPEETPELIQREVELGLLKEGDIWETISKLPAKYRVLLDYLSKTVRYRVPCPQVLMYSKEIKNEDYAQRHPYGVPSLSYYCRPSTSTTIMDFLYEVPAEKTFPLRYVDRKDFTFEISNSEVRIYGKGGLEVMDLNNIKFGRNKYFNPNRNIPKTASSTQEEFKWKDSTILLHTDGHIYHGALQAEMYLNNIKIENPKIKKAVFFPAKEQIEVVLLLDRNVMACGTIKEKEVIKEECDEEDLCALSVEDQNKKMAELKTKNANCWRLVCNVVEIPGTHGTTDFLCSPDFKSMLRISKMPPMKKRDVNLSLEETLDRLPKALEEFDAKLKRVGNPCRTTCKDHSFCYPLQIFMGLHRMYEQNEVQLPEDAEDWSAREKLCYSSHKLATDPETWNKFRHICTTKTCVFKDFFKLGQKFLKSPNVFPFEGELLTEFGFQLLMVLLSSATALEYIEKRLCPPKHLLLMANFSMLYNAKFLDIISYCNELFPSLLRPAVLDILCQKAAPIQFSHIIGFYEIEPELVLQAVKKYPYILLSNPHPLGVFVKLLDDFARYMENGMEDPEEPATQINGDDNTSEASANSSSESALTDSENAVENDEPLETQAPEDSEATENKESTGPQKRERYSNRGSVSPSMRRVLEAEQAAASEKSLREASRTPSESLSAELSAGPATPELEDIDLPGPSIAAEGVQLSPARTPEKSPIPVDSTKASSTTASSPSFSPEHDDTQFAVPALPALPVPPPPLAPKNINWVGRLYSEEPGKQSEYAETIKRKANCAGFGDVSPKRQKNDEAQEEPPILLAKYTSGLISPRSVNTNSKKNIDSPSANTRHTKDAARTAKDLLDVAMLRDYEAEKNKAREEMSRL